MQLNKKRSLLKGTIAALGFMVGTVAAAQDAKQADETDGATARTAFVEELSSGLYLLPINHRSILSVVQGSPQRVRIPVTVEVVDARGKRLLRERGVVGARRPLITKLRREDVFSSEPALVQARVRFGPAEPAGSGVLPPSCQVAFTIQTASGPEDTGDRETCVADPCSATQGIGGGSGRFPDAASCTRRSGNFTQ